MARALYGPPIRPRKRSRFWLAILVTVIAGIIILATQIRSQTRQVVEFLDVSRRVSASQSSAATTFRDVVDTGLENVDRDRFISLMGQLRDTAADDLKEIEAAEVPSEGAEAQATFIVALDSWRQGLGDFERSLLAVVDDPSALSVQIELAEALALLQVGDLAYGRFVTVAGQIEVDVDMAPFDEVAYVTGGAPVLADQLVARVRTSVALQLLADLAISQIRYEPGDVSDPSDNVIRLPATELLTVQVVVSNEGNRPENIIEVTLMLLTDDQEVVFESAGLVDALAPGEQGPVFFRDIEVAPNSGYQIEILVVPVDNEIDTENNRHDRGLFINDTATDPPEGETSGDG